MADDVTRRRFLGAAGAAALAGTAAAPAMNVRAGSGGGKVRIVAVCCSPRKGKSTAKSLEVCLAAAAKVDPRIETKLIELGGLSIPGQLAAGLPLAEGQQDDFPPVAKMLSAASVGGIIIGTPVYFGNMSFLCKAFLDRWIVFRREGFALANKVGGVLAVGGARNGGQELTIRSVQAALLAHEMVLVGDGRPTAHCGATLWSGAGKAGVTDDDFGMKTAENLGRRVAATALRLAAAS